MNDLDIYRELIRLAEAGIPAVLATIVETSGSSPRKAGAKLLVREDGTSCGSVGGGGVEQETIAAARLVLGDGMPRTVPITLTEQHGHLCGGRVVVYLEPVAIRPRLIIAGAGHVGAALARTAQQAGYRVTVADDRADFAVTGRIPAAEETLLVDYGALFGSLPVADGTIIVIATASAEKDFIVARGALGTPAAFIGLIGSSRKREVLRRTLAEEGYPAREIDRITIPVGLAIGAETPEEIAISIVAQLIERRKAHGAAGIGDPARRRQLAADGDLQATAAAG
ncbi:dehydrogenase [Geotalea uraniireducens]|uniref:Dehydrogenase n=1 Tax=Geotalea uraniireducens TaxID=351604 RepID=A0ABM8EPF7_9BACT|nr:XdhC/CoxI family protein [Geotalea uraniireducens]BDV44148.1 dehydrogenase [Geotalea uraniireducens]